MAKAALRLVLASDHAGQQLRQTVLDHLRAAGHAVEDLGPPATAGAVDYPGFGAQVARAVAAGAADLGIAICGSGTGMAMAANRIAGARAACCSHERQALLARSHNDANVLTLGAAFLAAPLALAIVDVFLATDFAGGRHLTRVQQLSALGDDMKPPLSVVHGQDPEVYAALYGEMRRQEDGLGLIASENFASAAVLATTGSVLTNKYAEGLPGKRYYGGCAWVDAAERLAIDRACRLFGADHANVQAHSGSQANQAVFLQVLEPGDTMLAMDLAAGGHLTHGSKVNMSGRIYKAVGYGVRRADQRIDYDALAEQARSVRPKLLIAGASAYSRTLDFARFATIAADVGATLLVDMAHIAGLVAAGVHPSPVPHADYVTTTTHKTLRGPRGGLALCRAQHAKRLDAGIFPRLQGGPLMHVVAAKAVALQEAMQPHFVAYQRQICRNAAALAAALLAAGFDLVAGGTDNHLVLVDLRSRGLTGDVAEQALEQAGIYVNKNMVPFDPEKPAVTSGIRMGTAGLSTRGLCEPEMGEVAALIVRALAHPTDASHLARVAADALALARRFPLDPAGLAALPLPAPADLAAGL